MINYIGAFFATASSKILVVLVSIVVVFMTAQQLHIVSLKKDLKNREQELTIVKNDMQKNIDTAVAAAKSNEAIIAALINEKQILKEAYDKLSNDRKQNQQQLDKILAVIKTHENDIRNKVPLSPVIKSTLTEINKDGGNTK